ncbi:MAG: hypothetical protein WCF20_11245 [Methylovirgula sp.]
MDKQPSHRLHIWALAEQSPAEQKKPAQKIPAQVPAQKIPPQVPAAPARQEKQERPARYERLRRSELLYTNLGGQARSLTAPDDVTMLTSLYDHRLPIDVELPGRATMPNGRSTTCKTRTISSESVDLVYDLQTAGYPIRHPEEIPAGSTVHLDLDQIGNFHGIVTSQNSEGFQLAVDVDCKGMLITKLARVAAAVRNASFDEAPLTARRSVTRIEPTVKNCNYTDHMGLMRKGKIINLSPSDALIKAAIIPPIATHIVFGGQQARVAEVTRTFEIGFAVQFCAPIPEEEFSAAIKFLDE